MSSDVDKYGISFQRCFKQEPGILPELIVSEENFPNYKKPNSIIIKSMFHLCTCSDGGIGDSEQSDCSARSGRECQTCTLESWKHMDFYG